jgi:hypothetical protein
MYDILFAGAQTWAHHGPTYIQHGSKMGPNGPNIYSNGYKWRCCLLGAQIWAHHGPTYIQHGSKTDPDGPRWAQPVSNWVQMALLLIKGPKHGPIVGPACIQHGSKMGPAWPKWAQHKSERVQVALLLIRGPNMGPSWAQHVSNMDAPWAQMGPNGPKLVGYMMYTCWIHAGYMLGPYLGP